MQVHSDVRRKDSAFLLAGPELYRFDMPQDVFRATQVIFRDSHMDVSFPKEPGVRTRVPLTMLQPAIQALVQVDNSPDPENIIVCATSDQIFYADVGQSERLCGRRLRLYETPRRLLLHNSLNVFIVACSRTVQEEVSRRTSGGGAMHAPTRKRISYCSLKFLDPFTYATPALIDRKIGIGTNLTNPNQR